MQGTVFIPCIIPVTVTRTGDRGLINYLWLEYRRGPYSIPEPQERLLAIGTSESF